MTTYILLRDNKESTPLTLPALKSIGLKSSDLIWVEGQSVCWLNPGQVKELRELVQGGTINEQFAAAVIDPVEINEPSLPLMEETKKPEITTPANEEIKKPEPVQSVPDQKHVFVSLPESKKTSEPVFHEQEYAHYLPKNEQQHIPLAETKYSKPLSEIKEIYLENLEKRKARQNWYAQIPPQVKRVAVYAILFITGLTAGIILSRRPGKKPVTAQTDATRTASAEIANQTDSPGDSATVITDAAEFPVKELTPQEQALKNESQTTHTAERTSRTGIVNESLMVQNPVTPDPAPTDPNLINAENTKTEDQLKENKKPSVKEIYSQVAVKNNDYTVGSFGGIKNLELTVTNHSKYALDEVQVQVRYYKPMDEFLKSETISFHAIPPGGSKTIPVKKTNRGVRVSSKVSNIKSSDLMDTAGL